MEKLKQTLSQINWNFSDYNSTKYPLDINSIPWYPATFPAPIPKFLIALLTNEGDIVLDPFGGKGTTCVESLKQNRASYYNDLNPFAVDITKHIVDSLRCCNFDVSILEKLETNRTELVELKSQTYLEDIIITKETKADDLLRFYTGNIKERFVKNNISEETIWWYHVDTLTELLNIFEIERLQENGGKDLFNIKKLAFVTILKEVSSQRGHFTYVTDNCRPKKLRYYSAISAYVLMLERIKLSIENFLKQNSLTNKQNKLMQQINSSIIHRGDARKLDWIDNNSIDLVITSPPYLCAQDYIRTMRLYNFFFPDRDFKKLSLNEIGARSKRRGIPDKVINEFYSDMQMVFEEIYRVLKTGKFFCLIIGQGKGKITQGYDTITDLVNKASNCGFGIFFQTKRNISYKSVRIGGVDTEDIIIFQKQ